MYNIIICKSLQAQEQIDLQDCDSVIYFHEKYIGVKGIMQP